MMQLLSFFRKPRSQHITAGSRSSYLDSGVSLFSSSEEILQSVRKRFFSFFKAFRKKPTQGNRRSFRRKQVASERTGRNIKLVRYIPGQTVLSPYHTVLAAAMNGRYDWIGRRFRIGKGDLTGWLKKNTESMTLLLTIDLSRSTSAFKDILAEILKSLREYFNRHNDRIGLISLQGVQGKVLNHPTRNHRVIIKNLTAMRIQGTTPLADGLRKALDMAGIEKAKNPASKCVAILMSDCFPEPVTHQYADLMEEPVYQDAIRVSRLFRARKIFLLIINPSYRTGPKAKQTPGERLADRIITESRGRMIALATEISDHSGSAFLKDHHAEIERILKMIDNAFQSQQTGMKERIS